MENDIDDVLVELEKTLRQFKLSDLKSFAMRDLPETNWEAMKQLLKDDGENLNIRKAAAALTRMVYEAKPRRNDLESRLELLRIKAIGLSSTQTWHAYELLKNPHTEYEEDERHCADLAGVARSAGRALAIRVRVVRGQHEGIWFNIGHGKRLTVVSVHFKRRCLLFSTKMDNLEKIHDIARGFGYRSSKDLQLSGRHVPSLLRIIDTRRGAVNLNTLLRSSSYPRTDVSFTPKLTTLGLGLDFTNCVDRDNLFPILDDEFDNRYVKLQTLTVRGKGSERGSAKSTCVITSCDIAESLSDMLGNGFITENSVFLEMVNDKGKNDICIEVDVDQ